MNSQESKEKAKMKWRSTIHCPHCGSTIRLSQERVVTITCICGGKIVVEHRDDGLVDLVID